VDNNHEHTLQILRKVLDELEKKDFILAGSLILTLTFSYFLIDSIGIIPSTVQNFLLSILSNLIPVFLLSFMAYAFFRRWSEEGHSEQYANVLAKQVTEYLTVSLKNIIHEKSSYIVLNDGKLALHTFYGLHPNLNEGTRIFQNFDVQVNSNDGANINAVYYLWADTRVGSYVHAQVSNDSQGLHFLTVSFENEPSRYPCNVAIRPQSV